jgi:transcriptional regulator with XRE-family HTH domain
MRPVMAAQPAPVRLRDGMDDRRLGAAFRAVRIRRGWRQEDLSRRANLSRGTVSRIERGHVEELSVGTIRRLAAALDIRVELRAWWRAGDLDRLLNAKHSALAEEVTRHIGGLPSWVLAPEVSFAIFGERGVIDILAWHPGRRALLVIELKTDIVDVNELLGTLDRKRRLAAIIAADRGWNPLTVSCWLIVAAGRTNQARVAAHRALLRAALPESGPVMRRWLRDPVGSIAAYSFWNPSGSATTKYTRPVGIGGQLAACHRVSTSRPRVA